MGLDSGPGPKRTTTTAKMKIAGMPISSALFIRIMNEDITD
jgi:hypothetical protein